MRFSVRGVMIVAALPTAAVAAMSTGPAVSRRELFRLLDLERSGLANVREALQMGDEERAASALADWLRKRPQPTWTVDPTSIGQNRRASTSAARAVLNNRLESIGISWQFGETVDWGFNPTTQPDSKWPVNHEWTWQLNRHAAWLVLARAFHDTGDEMYAAKLADMIRHWIRSCPPPADRADNRPGSTWRTIEAGIRTGSIWPEVWPRVLASKALDDDTLLLWLASWVDHARYLMRNQTSGNWLTMEANGLYHVGALFPEFRDAPHWRTTALARLTAELENQVYPDGAQIELAPGYHAVSLRNFLGPVELVQRTGFAVSSLYTAKLERMFEYLLASMQPTRRMPPLNDSGAGDVLPYFKTALRLFPQRRDFQWLSTDGREGEMPLSPVRFLPFAGQVFFRNGWQRDAVYVAFDAGPFGYGHQHEDKLSLLLTAYGEPLLVEGGNYTYDASLWRRWVLSSHAHNVILVDGRGQNRRKSPRETWVVREPLPIRFATHEGVSAAEAQYDEGWGPDARRLATHQRCVVFLLPDILVVRDRLTPSDSEPHRYEALFHLNAPEAIVSGHTIMTRRNGPNLQITAFGPDGIQLVKGQTNPAVLGWIPDSSLGYGGIRPIQTAVCYREAIGPVEFFFVIRPTRGNADESSPPRSITMSDEALTIEWSEDSRRSARWRWASPLPER